MSAFDAGQIPEVLKLSRQWCCWKYSKRKGKKPAKVPICPKTGRPLRPNHPDEWEEFDRALESYQNRNFGSSGIGFVLTKDDRFSAVDLDNCRNLHTGNIRNWAKKIVTELKSYTEVSPSGTGLRIIIRVKKKDHKVTKRKNADIEVFFHACYFTVTGNRLDEFPKNIRTMSNKQMSYISGLLKKQRTEDRSVKASAGHEFLWASSPKRFSLQEQLTIERASRAKNNEKFKRLFFLGDFSGYPSQSEADLALCAILSFWTGRDALVIDPLFRKSALYRKKWDEAHHGDGTTYGEATIMQATSNCNASFEFSKRQ
jgi:putative DNA primase/helicase